MTIYYLSPESELNFMLTFALIYCSLYKEVLTFNISCLVIEEKGLRLKLTVTDTPGFGDHVDNTNW